MLCVNKVLYSNHDAIILGWQAIIPSQVRSELNVSLQNIFLSLLLDRFDWGVPDILSLCFLLKFLVRMPLITLMLVYLSPMRLCSILLPALAHVHRLVVLKESLSAGMKAAALVRATVKLSKDVSCSRRWKHLCFHLFSATS